MLHMRFNGQMILTIFFRLSRRKRTRIWILSLVIENETVWDEVDVYIETQKRRDRTRSRFFSV